ncbi:MAG: hypothetical protein IJ581_01640 [Paludibacteraceae bacterium]|nr:hypothetical protein [Paludibacteraceae bacterium]
MMRRILLYILLLTAPLLSAQDYYRETMERVSGSTPYQALYILWDYQQTFPQFAPTYYEMGVRNQALVPTMHPIRQYNELSQCLYRVRLYMGNCLHYAKEQNLKARYYPGLPMAGKNPTYEDLQTFLRGRMEQAATAQVRVDSLYHAYCRLQSQYERCNLLFSQFVTLYPREKNAHLLLNDEARGLLDELATAADSLPHDIETYLAALDAYPIPNYRPTFQSLPIVLYRLDGLTTANLLENNVLLWDYATWVRHFLEEQRTVYTAFMDDIARAHESKEPIDDMLLNRLDRIDYRSFMHPRMWLEQQERRLLAATEHLPEAGVTMTDDELLERLEQQYDYYCIMRHVEEVEREVAQRIDEVAWRKYQALCTRWQEADTTLFLASTRRYGAEITRLYQTLSTDFFARIQPGLTPFVGYTNDLTGVRIAPRDIEETCGKEIVAVVPLGQHYMVVRQDAVCLLNRELELLDRKELSMATSPVAAAYKVTSNTIALVCPDRVLFVDNQGNAK